MRSLWFTGLKARTDLFTLRFDVPSKCATLLHDRTVDLALIPSIEYLRNDDCRIVPGMAVASTGPVASVALFTDRPATAIRSIAVDASSRTAAALLRVLSAEWFDIEPTFVTLRPDLTTMLKRCDAALLIGDARVVSGARDQRTGQDRPGEGMGGDDRVAVCLGSLGRS